MACDRAGAREIQGMILKLLRFGVKRAARNEWSEDVGFLRDGLEETVNHDAATARAHFLRCAQAWELGNSRAAREACFINHQHGCWRFGEIRIGAMEGTDL